MWDIMIAMHNGTAVPEHTVRTILSRYYVTSFLSLFGFLAAYHAMTPTLPLYLATLGSNERDIGILEVFGGGGVRNTARKWRESVCLLAPSLFDYVHLIHVAETSGEHHNVKVWPAN
jgi:hypothetical protein